MIDVRQQINDVRRTLGDRTLEAGEGRVQTISQLYDTGIDDMWTVVSSPDRIARWFLPVSGELKEGGSYQLEGNAGGTISKCDRPNGYDATWEYGGMLSWIEVRLTPEGSRTRFELHHIAPVPEDTSFWDQFGPGATGVGWDMGLIGLASYLADPSSTPDPAKMTTWHETPEGSEFIRAASDRWAEAAITYGDDPEKARASADRTYAFYTGT
jgi:uncharacterized protein YndB with AHSA1/START domain